MQTKLYYNDIEKTILINLSKAETEVKIAVSWLTNPTLFNEVLNLAKKKVRVDLILADDIFNFSNEKIDFNKLISLKANIYITRHPKLMHNKFCIIDNRILIQGSYNWTLRAEQYNYENIILSLDKAIIIQFNDYFEHLKRFTEKLNKIDKASFKKYHSQAEIDFEFGLETTKNTYDLNNLIKEKDIYTDEIYTEIDNMYLLYNEMKHQECIDKCNSIIQKYPNIYEFYLILAKCYWRKNQFNKMIDYAKKVIDIDNEVYEAYNLLGIGYTNRVGSEQQAIKYYNICLNKYPNSAKYLRNRAFSYLELQEDENLTFNLKNQYKKNKIEDLNKIIELLGSRSYDELDYNELDCLAFSYYHLNETKLAFDKINEAIRKFNATKDKFVLDKNELQDIKEFSKEIKKMLP